MLFARTSDFKAVRLSKRSSCDAKDIVEALKKAPRTALIMRTPDLDELADLIVVIPLERDASGEVHVCILLERCERCSAAVDTSGVLFTIGMPTPVAAITVESNAEVPSLLPTVGTRNDDSAGGGCSPFDGLRRQLSNGGFHVKWVPMLARLHSRSWGASV